MVSQHKNPRILLLGGALEYQSVSNKLESISTEMEKESDHLKMVVSKIEAHRPNVLLVEKSVSSYAQEDLLAKEISLVLNVKRSILERISLCTGAQLVQSIDRIDSAQLGQCEVFRVEKVVEECALGIEPNKRSVKTLMYFDGRPRRLGCTIILRGPCLEELKKVKHVISLAIFKTYNLSLETTFLANEGATLPKLPIMGPSSISENVMNADVVVTKASMSAGSSIATNKPLIFAEHADRNEYLEVPDEYYCTADCQSILVSRSITCLPKGTVCERSQLFRIKFYGSFDIPLGRYLHEELFDQTSSCKFCNEPADVQTRSYTHHQGSLTISVKRLTSKELPGERDGRIWMWHRCLMFEPKDGIPPATNRVLLSDAARSLSFGKFLELSFSNHETANRLASCGHSLQKDCLRFYGFGNMVAFFRYSDVDILSVYLPPLVLDFSCHTMQEWLRGETNQVLGGKARRKKLLSPKGMDVRPMMEVVRGAAFDILQVAGGCPASLRPGRWLDLYSGTGSVGIEAISRGCLEAHFVEMDPWVVSEVLRPNLEWTGFLDVSVIHTLRVEKFLELTDLSLGKGVPFDYISVTPPYTAVNYSTLMEKLAKCPFVGEDCFILVEYPLKTSMEDSCGHLVKIADRRFGRTNLLIYGPSWALKKRK